MPNSHKHQHAKHKKLPLLTESPTTPPTTDKVLYQSRTIPNSITSPTSTKSTQHKSSLFKPFSFLSSSSQETLSPTKNKTERHKRKHVHLDPLKPCHHKSCLFSKPDTLRNAKQPLTHTRSLIDTNTHQLSLHNSISNEKLKETSQPTTSTDLTRLPCDQLLSSPPAYSPTRSKSIKKSPYDHQDQSPQSEINSQLSTPSHYNSNDVFVLSSDQFTNPSSVDFESTVNIFTIIENLLHASLIQSNFITQNQDETQFTTYAFHDRIYTTIVQLLPYLPINRRKFPILFHYSNVINIPESERNLLTSTSNLVTLSQFLKPIIPEKPDSQRDRTITTLSFESPTPIPLIEQNHSAFQQSNQLSNSNESDKPRLIQLNLPSTPLIVPSSQNPLIQPSQQTTNTLTHDTLQAHTLNVQQPEAITYTSDSDSSDSELSPSSNALQQSDYLLIYRNSTFRQIKLFNLT